jgi:hypothetical protein
MSNDNPLLPNSFQTPNIYVDEFMWLLTDAEYKVLSYAARRIFGFQKRTDRISISQFVSGITTKEKKQLDHGTGLSKNTVRLCLAELIKFGLIVEITPGNPLTNEAAEYTLQTDVSKVNEQSLVARHNLTKKVRTRKPPKPVSIGDTGQKPIPVDDTALGQLVIQPYSKPRYSPGSIGDTTKPSRNPVETQRNIHAANPPIRPKNEVYLIEDYFTKKASNGLRPLSPIDREEVKALVAQGFTLTRCKPGIDKVFEDFAAKGGTVGTFRLCINSIVQLDPERPKPKSTAPTYLSSQQTSYSSGSAVSWMDNMSEEDLDRQYLSMWGRPRPKTPSLSYEVEPAKAKVGS